MEDKVRRVLIRVIGTPIILAVLGGVLYWDYVRQSHLGLMVIMTIFTAGGLWEFYNMCRMKGYNPARYVGVILAVSSIVYSWCLPKYYRAEEVWDVLPYPAIQLLGFYILLKLVFRYGKFSIVDAALTFSGFIYLTLWGSIFYIIAGIDYDESPAFIVYIFLVNKVPDMAGYCFGKLFGKTKLAPTISPNKTWIGFLAGLIAGASLGMLSLTHYRSMDLPYLEKAINTGGMRGILIFTMITVITTLSAQFGDLLKSVIKRWAGVKDSGHLLPEFGGFIDMIDSFLISIPVYIFFIYGCYSCGILQIISEY